MSLTHEQIEGRPVRATTAGQKPKGPAVKPGLPETGAKVLPSLRCSTALPNIAAFCNSNRLQTGA